MSLIFFVVVFLVIPTTSAFDSTVKNSTFNSTTDNITGSSHVEKACLEFKPQSCSGVCGQFFALWCSCDEYCLIYGRCCFDYDLVCKEESQKAKQDHGKLMNVTIECDSNISRNDVPQQIITSCSLTNVSLKTVELCEEETKSSVVVSKVMSKRTELHYKNRHCMLCNGEDEDDIVYWSTMIGTNDPKQRPANMYSILQLFRNHVTIISPPNSREITCFPSMISSCDPYATLEEQRLCVENALSPIRYIASIYKNTFCLQCNVILPTDNDIKYCYPAERKDIFYGTPLHSFTFSMVFNWENNGESFVFIDYRMSKIQKLSCSFDDNDNLKECKVRKCFGTLQIVNNTCPLVSNHFGCIQYGFKINFTVTSNLSRAMTSEVELISSELVQFAASFERINNVTKYYSQNVTLYNITIVDDQITGIIILNRMAYSLCDSQLTSVSSNRYYEYLDTYLAINLNGSISTYRYTVHCYDWCHVFEDIDSPMQYQRSFTGKAEISRLDSTSSVTNFTPIPIYIVSLIGIMLTRLS